MISDRELWACAHQALREHEGGVDLFIAERVADLACKGDEAGVATWSAIADRVDRLRDTAGLRHVRH